MNLEYVVAAVGAYLFGSIPVGLLVGKIYRRIDIREYGSGRTGSTNTLRTLGAGAAAIVLVLDVVKGMIPVAIAGYVSDNPSTQAVAGVAVMLGHDFPIYVGFRGGRGVATGLGATAVMMPWIVPVILVSGLILLVSFRYVSLMSIGSAPISLAVVLAFALRGDVEPAYAIFGTIATALIIGMHHENIKRLLAGTEPKIGRGGGRRAPSGRVPGAQ